MKSIHPVSAPGAGDYITENQDLAISWHWGPISLLRYHRDMDYVISCPSWHGASRVSCDKHAAAQARLSPRLGNRNRGGVASNLHPTHEEKIFATVCRVLRGAGVAFAADGVSKEKCAGMWTMNLDIHHNAVFAADPNQTTGPRRMSMTLTITVTRFSPRRKGDTIVENADLVKCSNGVLHGRFDVCSIWTFWPVSRSLLLLDVRCRFMPTLYFFGLAPADAFVALARVSCHRDAKLSDCITEFCFRFLSLT